ncbi:MAG: potassium transporter [Spirochaetales bacterium]|nr:potassium transporter [Spirochaetales bacterium]
MLIRPEKRFLFSYYIIIILVGSILLSLPFSWNGKGSLSYIDAFFTSASAVCVTGLITVDTAQFSLFGKIIILLMIQAGGLGIIGFTTIYLAIPSLRLSLKHRMLVKELYLDDVEFEPQNIMKQIVFITLLIEFIGAVFLWIGFAPTLKENAPLAAIFHSISAFCNSGFSIFSTSMEGFVGNPIVNFTVMGLVILGGLGFMVIRDIAKRVSGKKRRLALHSRIVLVTSLCLILLGAVAFFALEYNNAYARLNPGEKVMAAVFQSVTPRTAGFDTVTQSKLSAPSKLLTLPLMYIGASSGSTGGGIKTTTFAVILLMALFGSRRGGEIVVGGRRLPASLLSNAAIFMLKIFMILFVSLFVMSVVELVFFPGPGKDLFNLTFEAFSAFGTVGLSQGVTPNLSVFGKLILVFLMFEGKAGLLAMALTSPTFRFSQKELHYPSGEVLIG